MSPGSVAVAQRAACASLLCPQELTSPRFLDDLVFLSLKKTKNQKKTKNYDIESHFFARTEGKSPGRAPGPCRGGVARGVSVGGRGGGARQGLRGPEGCSPPLQGTP